MAARPVGYRLRRAGGQWQAYDAVVDGLSMVANYRAEFSKAIRNTSFDNPLDQMKAKRKAMSALAR